MLKRDQMEWTDERIAKLKELWARKPEMSATTIARYFGTTRNAVLGKISRLGLHNRNNMNSHPGPHSPAIRLKKQSEI